MEQLGSEQNPRGLAQGGDGQVSLLIGYLGHAIEARIVLHFSQSPLSCAFLGDGLDCRSNRWVPRRSWPATGPCRVKVAFTMMAWLFCSEELNIEPLNPIRS